MAPKSARFDPNCYLPLELFIRVLRYCPFDHIVRCQLVSKSWRAIIIDSSELWTDLDFRQANWPLSAAVVKEGVERSRGALLRVQLCELDDEDEAYCEELLSCNTWPRLTTVRLESRLQRIADDNTFLQNLANLTIHIKDAPAYVSTVLLIRPPHNLRELYFHVDWFELFRDTIHFDIPINNTITVPNVEFLRIGSEDPEEKYLYRYLTSPLFTVNKWILMWMIGLQRLLSVFPGLRSFSMVRIDAFAIGAGGFQHSAELDFTQLEHLKEVVVKYSMIPQILLNCNCEKLIFVCSTEIPRFVIVTDEGQIHDSHGKSGPALKGLTLSDVAYPFLGNFSLIRILRSIDSQHLTTLNLSSACYHRRLIDYSSTVYSDIDVPMIHYESDDTVNRYSLAQSIVLLCPRLRHLILGNTVTDESLMPFATLAELEDAEIWYSSDVTRFGIFNLLRIPYDADLVQLKYIPTEEIIASIAALRSPIQRLTIRDCRNIYPKSLEPLSTRLDVEVNVHSTTTLTTNGDTNNLDLLTHYRWHIHGYDRIRDLPEQRNRLEVVRNGWRSDAHWI
ncbi:uncharacterized protein V1513DRAFT_395387 [Lipomyces chichibuensis]|uniref:uncharacterized protein n=1 Tax=Lipomyces chichibuensis TaxID=1546026 RepID=UPI003343133E